MTTGESTSSLAIVGLRRRVRSILGTFRELTGFTVVATLAPASFAPDGAEAGMARLVPPVHPRCAARLAAIRGDSPCREQWSTHLRSGRHSPRVRAHVCPLGLHCAGVPVRLDSRLVGMVKVVAGAETSGRRFAAAARLLGVVVSGVSQESAAARVQEAVSAPTEQREIEPAGLTASATANRADSNAVERHEQRGPLVEAALSYLDRHYQTADLCLLSVARTLGCNPRYLTTRFTRVVGERMHPYLVGLRVAHASRLLIETGVPVKEVAFASGFRDSTALARAFRRRVGTSPGEYRRVFGG